MPRRGGQGSQLHYRLLPAHILSVADLDATHLQQALRRFNGLGRSITLEFRVIPMGRFDAALIPVGRVGEQPDRWLLALEQGVPVQDQVALYGHAVGYLLLNYQEEPCYPNAQPGAVYRASRPCARSTLYWLRYWQLIRIT